MTEILDATREVRVNVHVSIEPELTEYGYLEGTKKATGLTIVWAWRGTGWERASAHVHYRRVKKNGELYAGGQSDSIYAHSFRDITQFKQLVESTRPAWTPGDAW